MEASNTGQSVKCGPGRRRVNTSTHARHARLEHVALTAPLTTGASAASRTPRASVAGGSTSRLGCVRCTRHTASARRMHEPGDGASRRSRERSLSLPRAAACAETAYFLDVRALLGPVRSYGWARCMTRSTLRVCCAAQHDLRARSRSARKLGRCLGAHRAVASCPPARGSAYLRAFVGSVCAVRSGTLWPRLLPRDGGSRTPPPENGDARPEARPTPTRTRSARAPKKKGAARLRRVFPPPRVALVQSALGSCARAIPRPRPMLRRAPRAGAERAHAAASRQGGVMRGRAGACS